MKQVIHIFTKDIRHFWPEIAASLVITAAFGWVYPTQWRSTDMLRGYAGRAVLAYSVLPLLRNTLIVLVPVSWCLLITRIVHAERLVGENQFWLTRPYQWKKLLAAKILFVICFLFIPFVASQCFLLIVAGFHPLFFLPGLLFNPLLVTGVFILPIFAIATVTSSLGRMTLSLIGILLCIICIGFVNGYFEKYSASSPYADRLSMEGSTRKLSEEDPTSLQPRYLCPGSPITFTRYEAVRRTQFDLPLRGFRLPALDSYSRVVLRSQTTSDAGDGSR